MAPERVTERAIFDFRPENERSKVRGIVTAARKGIILCTRKGTLGFIDSSLYTTDWHTGVWHFLKIDFDMVLCEEEFVWLEIRI